MGKLVLISTQHLLHGSITPMRWIVKIFKNHFAANFSGIEEQRKLDTFGVQYTSLHLRSPNSEVRLVGTSLATGFFNRGYSFNLAWA